jgi:hypothetical protein
MDCININAVQTALLNAEQKKCMEGSTALSLHAAAAALAVQPSPFNPDRQCSFCGASDHLEASCFKKEKAMKEARGLVEKQKKRRIVLGRRMVIPQMRSPSRMPGVRGTNRNDYVSKSALVRESGVRQDATGQGHKCMKVGEEATNCGISNLTRAHLTATLTCLVTVLEVRPLPDLSIFVLLTSDG